jgi:hypothetical protein
MRHAPAIHQLDDERHYARVESIILDLQLSIASVRRANGCLDLETVRRIRAHAAETLGHAESTLAQFRPYPSQTQRVADKRRALCLLLREPAPIEHLARSLRVG